jgi:hypothetical protein
LSEQVQPYIRQRPAFTGSILNKSQDYFDKEFSSCPQPYVNPHNILLNPTIWLPANRVHGVVEEAHGLDAGFGQSQSISSRTSCEPSCQS